MDELIKTSIQQQFGAAVKMLENALSSCPDELWDCPLWSCDTPESKYAEFWYIAYHTLFWLDLYLSGSVEGFTPPTLFTLSELDPDGLLPERTYSKPELLEYLRHCQNKAESCILALTDEKAQYNCAFSWGQVNYLELQLYNMRHVQEHAAQLNMLLGQRIDFRSKWVTKQ